MVNSIPLTVDWSPTPPHDMILAGCHDGTVYFPLVQNCLLSLNPVNFNYYFKLLLRLVVVFQCSRLLYGTSQRTSHHKVIR